MKKLPFALLLVVLGLTVSCDKVEQLKSVSANDGRFNYEGRIDFSDAASPEIVWQGSRIEIGFEGTELLLQFSNTQGQVFFDLTIDGETAVIKAQDGIVSCPIIIKRGKHSLSLVKRSEASAGTVRFDGIEAANVFKQPLANKSRTYLFFGDSITAGACNEDGDVDQWDDRSTHNANLSYAALTAEAMNAKYRNIAVSGMGISMGYTENTFPEIWNRFKPSADSPIAEVADFKPDIVFINLGENDNSFSSGQGINFPENYSSRYISMVREMRKSYPDSQFVILRGGMFGGSQSQRLLGPWQKAVGVLEAEDKNLTHFVFKHWSENHPRITDHQKMADELVAWLQTSQQMQ